MTPETDLSICVVSWKVKKHLVRCLRSIRASSGPGIETIVVDNASGDGSAEMTEKEFPEVKLILNDFNRGFAAAVNQALAVSRGRYFLLLNPDTIVQTGALGEMVGFLDSRPAAGAAGCRLVGPDGKTQLSARSFPTFLSALDRFTFLGRLCLFPTARRDYLLPDFDYDQTREVDQVMGAALMVRREAMEKVGRMDEDFFLYFEEVDLCRRLRGAGYSIWYNPQASIFHLGGMSFEQTGGEARFWLLKNQLRYFRKHCDRRSVARFEMIFKPLVLVGEIWGLALAGIELLAARLWLVPPRRKKRKVARWRRKIDFFTSFLTRFLREG